MCASNSLPMRPLRASVILTSRRLSTQTSARERRELIINNFYRYIFIYKHILTTVVISLIFLIKKYILLFSDH
jgi:hypothetical protein